MPTSKRRAPNTVRGSVLAFLDSESGIGDGSSLSVSSHVSASSQSSSAKGLKAAIAQINYNAGGAIIDADTRALIEDLPNSNVAMYVVDQVRQSPDRALAQELVNHAIEECKKFPFKIDGTVNEGLFADIVVNALEEKKEEVKKQLEVEATFKALEDKKRQLEEQARAREGLENKKRKLEDREVRVNGTIEDCEDSAVESSTIANNETAHDSVTKSSIIVDDVGANCEPVRGSTGYQDIVWIPAVASENEAVTHAATSEDEINAYAEGEHLSIEDTNEADLEDELEHDRQLFLTGRDERLPKEFEVPQFYPGACGSPRLWNDIVNKFYWGRRLQRRLTPVKGAQVNVQRVMEFLSLRPGPDRRPVRELLGEPMDGGEGWYCCPWAAFDEKLLPKDSAAGGPADWQRAWHGCKFEALYSIMYHGRLLGSCDKEKGDRFFAGAPGVYVHKDGTCAKTGNYMRLVPLCRDGVLWAALWEVRVDRADRIRVSNTDQWVQPERSVRLANLWLAGCTYDSPAMQPGWEVSDVWDPLMEANPQDVCSSTGESTMPPNVANAACHAKLKVHDKLHSSSRPLVVPPPPPPGDSTMPPRAPRVVNAFRRAKPKEPDKLYSPSRPMLVPPPPPPPGKCAAAADSQFQELLAALNC